MATTLFRRALSTVTDRTLWVCYADTGTVRRRLASLAQQVRRALGGELPLADCARPGRVFPAGAGSCASSRNAAAARGARGARDHTLSRPSAARCAAQLAMGGHARHAACARSLRSVTNRADGGVAGAGWPSAALEPGTLERVEIPPLLCFGGPVAGHSEGPRCEEAACI